MSEEKKFENKTLPYEIVVKYQNTLRVPLDFWRFRVVTNVLRQPLHCIESYKKRYSSEKQ